MSEKVWYIFQNNQQAGPFDAQQISQLFASNMIAKDSYLFKVGWKDWRPIEEGYEILGLAPVTNSNSLGTQDSLSQLEHRRNAAPRASISGRVVVHSSGRLSIGQGVNISIGGIFVETSQPLFTVGERLKISVRCEGMDKAFNAEATVIRFNNDSKYPIGYGLKFEQIEQNALEKIQMLVNEANRQGDRAAAR